MEVIQYLLHMTGVALRYKELTCCDIKQRHPDCLLINMKGRQEIILLMVQHIVM